MREGTVFTSCELTPLQRRVREENQAGRYGRAPKRCVVTGGTGFVGQRLVEMLVERGAERVVSFDIVPPAANMLHTKVVEYVVGDLTDVDAVDCVVRGADCVWHVGAAVGPYHSREVYERVNVEGTRIVVAACQRHGVCRLVYASSPLTRYDGRDFEGASVDDMPTLPLPRYQQDYSRTKAEGELIVRDACLATVIGGPGPLAVSLGAHQIYGPRESIFLPNLLQVAGLGMLRIFGNGRNRTCFTHVDNFAHALILGERALSPGSPALGKFYVVTDGHTHPHSAGYCEFWREVDRAVCAQGFPSLFSYCRLPKALMLFVGWACDVVGWLLGRKLKLSAFAVRLLTMHAWFDISATCKDLDYEPLVGFQEGWAETAQWFRERWLPTFDARRAGGWGGRTIAPREVAGDPGGGKGKGE